MITKQITLNAKGIPAILIGAGRGAYGVGKGHFICIQEEDRVRGLYIIGVARTNDASKEIAMQWGEVELGTTQLKALPEYFNPDGSCKVVAGRASSFESVSRGKVAVAPGVELYSYDLFYDLMGTDKAGIVLYAIAMDRYFKEKFGVNVLKIAANGYSFIQPVTFDCSFDKVIKEPIGNESALVDYKLKVTPIDGEGTLTISIDGVTYGASNEFTFTEQSIPTKIYVKDSTGTIASRTIALSNW